MQESRDPPGVPALNGVGKVVKFDGQVSTHLAQILNRPTCWRSAELTVGAVNVSPSLKQQLHDLTMPVECRIVERRGA